MNYFGQRLYTESELATLIDACIAYLQAVKYSPGVKAEERDKAISQVQNTLPLIRRYLVALKTREMGASK